MSNSQESSSATNNSGQHYDAIVIGAGMAGLYQLYKLQEAGLSVRVFETGSGVGGTWYWNRYPGCKFDSESYTYGYSFSQELLDEWEWKEHFSRQPDTEKYLNYVADKFDLRKDIQFNSKIKSAMFNEKNNQWDIETDGGLKASAKFIITAVGPLSAHTMPNYKGMDSFKGGSWHTARWPKETVDFTGKKVAVIGTGATGVQVIQEMAHMAETLTIFQRHPNWCAPLNNDLITDEEQKDIHANYPEIFKTCSETHGAFIHSPDPRSALAVTPEEREALYEKLYNERGFGIWVGSFIDTLFDETANATRTEFIANKIRSRVKDQELAERLIPKDHGFGTKRVPLETNYYEVYNMDTVKLVDLRETSIEEITPKGIRTSDGEYEFDYIIYATGFDPVTGALNRIDIRGKNGLKLVDKWAGGPLTYLGLQVSEFPNLFTLVGPHNAATLCNIPRCIEQNVEWVTELLQHMEKNNQTLVEPKPESVKSWTEEVMAMASISPFMKVNSWLSGINTNVPGKQERSFQVYAGGAPAYKEHCDNEAKSNYKGFTIS